MLSSPLSTLPNPAAEDGMTLIELLVAITTSIIVIGGLLAILAFSLNQQTRISNRVQADRTGRVAMNNVIDELHSSCTGFGKGGIQAPAATTLTSPLAASGPYNLWFVSSYGNQYSGEAVISHASEHDINWSASGTSNTGMALGTVTDYSWNNTSGNAKEGWTFPASLSTANANKTRVLARNVIPIASSLFQYYRFESTPGSATFGTLIPFKSTELPLTTTTAAQVARVDVTFTQAPESGDTRIGRTASYSSSVVLRFGPSETGAEAVNSPCA